MRVIVSLIFVSLVLAAIPQQAAFAQKPTDPEARDKRAVSVKPDRPGKSVQPHRSADTTDIPKTGSASARDLAKVERSSIQQMKTTQKTNNNLKAGPSALPTTKPRNQNKPIKFSYQASKNAATTSSAKNPPPPPVRPRSH